MSERTTRLPSGPLPDGDRFSEGGLRPPPEYGFWRRAWWWFDFLILVKLARLRFIAIVAAVGALILYWDPLAARFEKWTRPVLGQEEAALEKRGKDKMEHMGDTGKSKPAHDAGKSGADQRPGHKSGTDHRPEH